MTDVLGVHLLILALFQTTSNEASAEEGCQRDVNSPSYAASLAVREAAHAKAHRADALSPAVVEPNDPPRPNGQTITRRGVV